MKNFFRLFVALVATTFVFQACSKDSDSSSDGTVKVTYKIIGSDGVNISTVVYYEGDAPVSKTGDFGATWTSDEVTVDKNKVVLTANATGPDDNSTLKSQVLVNGKVVKESGMSTGKILTTSVNYTGN